MRLEILPVCFTWVVVLCAALSTHAQSIELNPQTAWISGGGDVPLTEQWQLAPIQDGAMRFVSMQPQHTAIFNFPAALNLDAQATPFLSLTYRASGDWNHKADRNLLVFYDGQPPEWPAVALSDLVFDGKPHTIELDLRKRLADSNATSAALRRMDLRVHAGASEATFELIALRFSPDPTQPQPAPQESPQEEPIQIRVSNPQGKPLAGATVTLDPHLKTSPGLSTPAVAITDAAGLATVWAAQTPQQRQTLRVEHPGMSAVLFRDLPRTTAQEPLDATLYPTRTYAGKVVDQQGQPVAGAIGVLRVLSLAPPSHARRPFRDFDQIRVVTDADGLWVSPPLPDVPELQMSLTWHHQDFLTDYYPYHHENSLNEERSGTQHHQHVLRQGVELTGFVFDSNGRPIAEALIAQGEDRVVSNPPPSTFTDQDGHFSFKQANPNQVIQLTATAPGFAPETRRITAPKKDARTEFRLEPASAFRFRVIDPRGRPISGARIFPDTWRGIRPFDGGVITDPKGEAVWDGPADAVTFDIWGTSQQDQRGVSYLPNLTSDEFHVVTLPDPLRVVVSVVDAQTGLPVTRFTPLVGSMWQNDKPESPQYNRRDAFPVTSNDGRWETTFSFPSAFRAVRIEAPGYAPAVSEPFANDAGLVELRLELEPAGPLHGTLIGPTGQPLPETDVYVAEGTWALQVSNGWVDHSLGHTRLTTDPTGAFSFMPPPDPYRLVVVDEAGYADVQHEVWLSSEDRRVNLQPWAQISGRVLQGGEPVTNERIHLYPQHVPHTQPRQPWHSLQTQTDGEGRFSFKRVPPGRYLYGHYITLNAEGRGSFTRTYPELVVEPGQQIELTLGGTGRAVTGQLELPQDQPHVILDDAIIFLAKIDGASTPPLPEGFEEKTPLEKRDYFFLEELNLKSRTKHRFRVETDGSFKVQDVEPGEYELVCVLFKPLDGRQCGFGDVLGGISQRVVVPDLPGGSGELASSLSLGKLPIIAAPPTLSVGDLVPPFPLPILPDVLPPDEPIDSSKLMRFESDLFTGQVTLIYFGASWCAPCHAEAPYLNRTWKLLKDEPRFSMLSISLDKTPAAAMAYAQSKGYRWPQAFAEHGLTNQVVRAFGVGAVPSFWIIGPDGRVVAKGFNGQAIIDQALSAASELLSD